ncbi:MAG: peptide ABC transporter ATP-binding protein [Rhizobiaceae bacterium]|nr:peptide ABC transporter ATP-binding protein [Rhizobiaceae bacterium]
MSGDLALSIRDLQVTVGSNEGAAHILDNVNLELKRGEIVGVAGESGCGKSTLVRTILGILPEVARIRSGEIMFRGENLLSLSQSRLQSEIRGSGIGFIPQDPYLAFNPVFTVGDQLLETLRWHGLPGEGASGRYTRKVRARHREHLVELLAAVQVPDPAGALDRYPQQFSGGQRQRLLIAGAIACQPEIILADEPTTALDVTTQMQILKLLKQLAAQFQVSMLFVSHDFGVISQLCDRILIMYAGQSVEFGPTHDVIENPRHPYTRMLLRCHPDKSEDLVGIPGQVPSPLTPPPGCRFNPRCPQVRPECLAARPPFVHDRSDGRAIACVLTSREAAA